METNYEKRGYLLDDFRLFHLKEQISTIIITNFASCCSCAAAMAAIP